MKVEEQKNEQIREGRRGMENWMLEMEEYIKSADFASLLEAKDVIALGQVSRAFRRVFNKEYTNLVVRLGNLEQEYRYLFWIHKIPYLE
jgi:hypothetical protein